MSTTHSTFYDVGHTGDSAGLMATVGWSFVTF